MADAIKKPEKLPKNIVHEQVSFFAFFIIFKISQIKIDFNLVMTKYVGHSRRNNTQRTSRAKTLFKFFHKSFRKK